MSQSRESTTKHTHRNATQKHEDLPEVSVCSANTVFSREISAYKIVIVAIVGVFFLLWSSLGNVKSFSVVFWLSSLVLLCFLFLFVWLLFSLTASRASNFKKEARRKLRAASPAADGFACRHDPKRFCVFARPFGKNFGRPPPLFI